ncbi:MAG: GNAT family N-acetyltransferase [Chloroflexi bacterium]|nr:GNAT family N-acetyltransferase [Chloroflexota bacterium]MCI0575900.1 GNAT family N-acetyltransferase [Chloroflexota bacterium]MCI0648305.1 GNAT family N-acetyltransferase [Chloroflexota bacterium]MCI0727714.1 GNAT family N-acetyltransferase [Chloroflexota bacterium]
MSANDRRQPADQAIRPYRPADAPALATIHQAVYPAAARPVADFRQRLAAVLAHGGRVWVALVAGQPAGYAWVKPLPGLPGITDLQGAVAPVWQGQGVGSALLRHLLADLAGSEIRQVSHAVFSLDSSPARFLQRHGFFVEHEEWQMERAVALAELPLPTWPPAFTIQTFPLNTAVRRFLQLYEAAFAGRPWYQPYDDETQVAAELASPAHLLLLLAGRTPAGFAWTRLPETTLGEIEPIGLIPAYQGQGLARPLLLAALRHLAKQGANRVRLGVWQNNAPAVRLYERTGFRQTGRLIYLAQNVNRELHE